MRGFEFQSVVTVRGSEPVIEWFWIEKDGHVSRVGPSLFHSLASCMADAERHQRESNGEFEPLLSGERLKQPFAAGQKFDAMR